MKNEEMEGSLVLPKEVFMSSLLHVKSLENKNKTARRRLPSGPLENRESLKLRI